MSTINLPTVQWTDSLKVGDIVYIFSTSQVGGDIRVSKSKIFSISKTGIMRLEGSSYSFKNGIRRGGWRFSGNCWFQETE